MDRVRVFIYGSLKSGFEHHDAMMRGALRERDRASAPGYRLHRVGAYPAMVRSASGVVHGEVYRVTAEHLARLDEFEDCPEIYQRKPIQLEDGSEALAYVMTPRAVEGTQVIENGRWAGPGGDG